MAKKKTSSTARSAGGKSVESRKRTKAPASSGNGAAASSSGKKKPAKQNRSSSGGSKKAAGSRKAAKKATARKTTTGKAASKKTAASKARTSKKSTKAAATKKTTKKAGQSTKKKVATGAANKGPLSEKELQKYRNLLLYKRAEILGDMSSMSEEALGSDSSNLSHMPIHMADVSSDGYERELMLGLVESERQVIREIDEALQRIAEGTYGICEATGKPIAKSRLNAKPWAKYCIEAAREMERQNGPPRY